MKYFFPAYLGENKLQVVINERCVGVAIETVLQVVKIFKFYTVVNGERILKKN